MSRLQAQYDASSERGSGNVPSICIVAHMAYGAMTGGAKGHIGGVERQTSMTAKWLASRGWRVSLITWNEGTSAEETIEGVRVIKLCSAHAGFPGVRFFHPRWTSLNHALRTADAELYYQNSAECVTGQVALWCHRRHRKFVFCAAHDHDVDPQLQGLPTIRERLFHRYGLRHADRIIVQTQSQQASLRLGFGLHSTVIPMPCMDELVEDYAKHKPPDDGNARILWIGRICRQKRPDRLLDLAEATPDLQFDLVGPGGDARYSSEILYRARKTRNVTVHGPVPRERVTEFYRHASCLCCTSDSEGFPNTFLEAWRLGLPIVTMFDPDGVIARQGLGAAAEDVPGVIEALRRLIGSQEAWIRASQNAKRYFDEHHAIDVAMPRFAETFCDVVAEHARR